MRKKLEFWMLAIFCGCISLITVIGNWVLTFKTGASHGGVELVFYCFLPMCFYMVRMSLSKLQQHNAELRRRIDILVPASNGGGLDGRVSVLP